MKIRSGFGSQLLFKKSHFDGLKILRLIRHSRIHRFLPFLFEFQLQIFYAIKVLGNMIYIERINF